MNTGTFHRAGKNLLTLLCLMSLILCTGAMRAEAEPVAMRSYCNVPPLAGFGVKPNLLLMIDNSASMYDLAYTDSSKYCLDDSADTYSLSTEPYPGYFTPETFYRYSFNANSSGNEIGYFEPTADSSIPKSTCNAVGNDYLCVNVSAGKVNNFLASGNFLNWLSMSKLDIEKMALTGGKFDPATGLLQAETRGCQGKRYIKMLGDYDLTFAVRGPVMAEGDYVYQASQGGQTRIEIYAKRYNKDACLAAVTAWQKGDVDDLNTQTAACMTRMFEADNTTPSKGNVYIQIMSGCYSYLAGVDGALASVLPKLTKDCKTRILKMYGDKVERIRKNEGDQICGKGVYHEILYHNNLPYSKGYLGECYFPGGIGFLASCTPRQAEDFCQEVANPSLTDPSTTAIKAGTNANVPGFVLEAGLYNLGEIAGTMLARTTLAAAPSGLVQEFSEAMNFGAMVFNSSGAGSECGDSAGEITCVKHCKNDPAPQMQCYQDSDCKVKTAGSCSEDGGTDGGRIISYLNHSPLGDHGSGLIAAIDQVRADSWTPLAESFYLAIGYFANRPEFRLQAADFDPAFPPAKYSCQKNNVLIVTDGMSTADRALPVRDFVAAGVSAWVNSEHGMPASQTTTDPAATAPPFQGSNNLDDLAWIARNKNIFDTNQPIQHDKEYISSYVVYSGAPCAGGDCSGSDEGVPEKMMQLVASRGGGKMLKAQKPKELVAALRNMLQLIGAGTNSTTDPSILSSGDGNGALFLQEQFYRSKSFDGGATNASWIGEMQGLWYFIDPFIGSTGGASAIREDTGGLKSLDLTRNRVVKYVWDTELKQTRAKLYLDGDGDGDLDPSQPTGYPLVVSPDAVQSLWRAGLQLWERDPATRTIYTQTDGRTLIGFTKNAKAASYLDPSRIANQSLLQASSESEAASIISFVEGADSKPPSDGSPPSTRGRVVAVGTEEKIWKLGDIISSTPVPQSAVSLGSYHLIPPRGYADESYKKFVGSQAYQGRGTVYVGANDGMLHAFNLGTLKLRPESGEDNWPATKKAVLSGVGIGKENWAYIPKNVLPYLRYLKEPLYPHLYYVDGSSTIADVSIGDPASCEQNSYWNCAKDNASGNNWRTVLISGMGLGGASREPGDCVDGAAGTCVKSPLTGAGLSSYFALDVTGQTSGGTATPPRLLWEFSHDKLGYATSGAAIVKINATSGGNPASGDSTKNGRWFAVFASGPTGPIDPASCQFLGKSDQNLKLFIVDLNASEPLVERGNYWIIDTGIANAFGGSMSRAGIDTDKWNSAAPGHYQDDALYLGYTRQADDGSWTGGVLRLLTDENLDPGQWKTSKVIDNIGPVTGSVSKLQDRKNHKLWLYFGTGRFLHNQDDLTTTRAIFGVNDPCYTQDDALDGQCSASALRLSNLTDMTDNPEAEAASDSRGWWIGLDKAAGSLGSERFTTNPASLTSGAVFFTTFKPPSDVCLQGESYLWGVKYDTGGSVAASLQGKALVPLSNGSSAEFSLTGLTDRGDRRSQAMTGKPGGVKLITNSGLKPLKKILHIQER